MNQLNPSHFFNRSSLYVALLTAWVAMFGSLYFSEVLGYIPCDLCWYQRIFMYPLTVILAVGLLRQDGNLPYYVLPLSIIGQGISTYHYLIQKTTIFGAPTVCRSGVPCTTSWINWFGFVTIPFLAMVGFFIITIMVLIALTSGEPDELANQPTPWWQVAGVIAAVMIAFAILYWFFGPPQPALALTEVATEAPISTPAETSASEDTSGSAAVDLAQGEEIYRTSCAPCHGVDARGIPNLGKNLVDSELVNTGTDVDILALIRQGVAVDDPRNTTGVVMPPSGGRPNLSDAELLSVVHWIRAQ